MEEVKTISITWARRKIHPPQQALICKGSMEMTSESRLAQDSVLELRVATLERALIWTS